MTDEHIEEDIVRARHAHKGYLPSPWHLDRPESTIVYTRTVRLSWDKLERQMQVMQQYMVSATFLQALQGDWRMLLKTLTISA